MEAGGRIQQDDPVANRSTGQSYDADGRVRQIETADGHRVESIYDFRGERIARIVDRGQPSQAVTFYYGKYLSVTGSQMTRAFYLGNRLIAESTIAAPAGLTLARSLDPEQRIMVARAIHDAVGRGLYPHVHLGTTTSVALGGTIAILCIGLFWLPGQRRVAIIGKVRRGRVLLIVIVFGASLTPLPWVEPAEAGCTSNCGGTPPPAPPKFPTLFVHGDHLGSTVLLTCYEQPSAMSCGNGSVYRYLRYDAYGRMSAYNASQQLLARGQEGTERTYTGQRWDWQAQVYYYGARFYDPQVARFSALDPVREHMNPYAYVMWRPVMFTDPTGMITSADAGTAAGLNFVLGGYGSEGPCRPGQSDYPISGPMEEGPSFDELSNAAAFASLLFMRGMGKGPADRLGGVALLLTDLPGFLESTGLSPGQAQVGTDILAELGSSAVMGTNLAAVAAAIPGGMAALRALSAGIRGGGAVRSGMALIGLASLPGSPDLRAGLSDLGQILGILPLPHPGVGIGADVLAFGLTQMSINDAYGVGAMGETGFTALSNLNLISLGAGVLGNSVPHAGAILGASTVQLVSFGVIGSRVGHGPFSGMLLGR